MDSGFKCRNCGKCCSSVYSQINLTLGDISRISAFIGIPVSGLFRKNIGISPFGYPEKPAFFTYGLGINMPCGFRIDEKCSIYNSRPANCRLFPYWVLIEAFVFGKKEIIDTSYACMSSLSLSSEQLRSYSEYKMVISDVLSQESSLTESLLCRLAIPHEIDLSELSEYKNLLAKYKGCKSQASLKKLETEKINLCKRLSPKLSEDDIKKIEQEISKPFLAAIIMNNTKRMQLAEENLMASIEPQQSPQGQ